MIFFINEPLLNLYKICATILLYFPNHRRFGNIDLSIPFKGVERIFEKLLRTVIRVAALSE